MKLMDWLHKLGIIRGGFNKGTYTSARDMPDEIFMDDVYDAKRDLTGKEDIKKALGRNKTTDEQEM